MRRECSGGYFLSPRMITLQTLVDRIPWNTSGTVSVKCDCGAVYFSNDLLQAEQQGLGDIIWCTCGKKYTPEDAVKARIKKGISNVTVTHKAKYNPNFQNFPKPGELGLFMSGIKSGKSAFMQKILEQYSQNPHPSEDDDV